VAIITSQSQLAMLQQQAIHRAEMARQQRGMQPMLGTALGAAAGLAAASQHAFDRYPPSDEIEYRRHFDLPPRETECAPTKPKTFREELQHETDEWLEDATQTNPT